MSTISRYVATASGGLVRTRFHGFTPTDPIKGRERMQRLKEQGSFLSEYDDMVWKMTDGRRTCNIRFDRYGETIRMACEETGMDADALIGQLKMFCALHLQTADLVTIRQTIHYILHRLADSRMGQVTSELPSSFQGAALRNYAAFLFCLEGVPETYLAFVEQTLQDYKTGRHNGLKNKEGHQRHTRKLADFASYCKFDHHLREDWDTMSRQDKDFLYPMYLFWITTTILPLRVTEFCMTSLKCVQESNGHYYLTVRRTSLKGFGLHIHQYNEEDFVMDTVEITRYLYDLYLGYMARASHYPEEKDRLISKALMKASLPESVPKIHAAGEPFFCSEDIRILFNYYFHAYMEERHGYDILTREDLLERFMGSEEGEECYDLDRYEIEAFTPAHTRHLALINLVWRGCNPMSAYLYAGHAEEMMSSHYYKNISTMLKSAVRYYFSLYYSNRNNVSEDIIGENPASFLIDTSQPHIRMETGDCYSPAFYRGEGTDCEACGWNCLACRYMKTERRYGQIRPGSVTEKEKQFSIELNLLMDCIKSEAAAERMEEFQLRWQETSRQAQELSRIYWKQLEEERNNG